MSNYVNPFAGPGGRVGWNDLLEEPSSVGGNPGAGYALFQQRVEGPPNLKRWLEQQYNRLYNEYSAKAASDPGAMWFDYLANLNMNKEYGGLPPFQRGERPGVMAPRTRSVSY